MSFLEVISIIFGLILGSVLIMFPLVLPAFWYDIKFAIYKIIYRIVDGPREYDENGDYISRCK